MRELQGSETRIATTKTQLQRSAVATLSVIYSLFYISIFYPTFPGAFIPQLKASRNHPDSRVLEATAEQCIEHQSWLAVGQESSGQAIPGISATQRT